MGDYNMVSRLSRLTKSKGPPSRVQGSGFTIVDT